MAKKKKKKAHLRVFVVTRQSSSYGVHRVLDCFPSMTQLPKAFGSISKQKTSKLCRVGRYLIEVHGQKTQSFLIIPLLHRNSAHYANISVLVCLFDTTASTWNKTSLMSTKNVVTELKSNSSVAWFIKPIS